jgi:hypothetical protein
MERTMKLALIAQANLFLLLVLLTACALLPLPPGTQPLPDGLKVEKLVDGYPFVLRHALDWSSRAYLESANAGYRRVSNQWRIFRAHYTFVDAEQMRYIGLTIDLESNVLEISSPGQVGGKTSIVTTTHFDLENNPINEQEAISRALAFLSLDARGCLPQQVGVSGHGEIRQVWSVNFLNPYSSPFLPTRLFLATVYVDAINGQVDLGVNALDELCNR